MADLATQLIVFTDLDGSLLDHDTYSWEAASAWLSRLKRLQIPIVITTSKTAAEVTPLQQMLGLSDMPFIAENGALVSLPGWSSHADYPRKIFNADYPQICRLLHNLRDKQRFAFRGFSDMSDEEVADVTGLDLAGAALARCREASEPIQWRGDAVSLAAFRLCLRQHQLELTQGGRFYHVMGCGISKGNAVNWLKIQYEGQQQKKWVAIGLGDGPNDVSMLQACRYAVVIKGQASQNVQLPDDFNGEQFWTGASGPAGWSEGLNYFLRELII
ncbi:mannosyl-3-phosphoglycerate phosphatase-related protein [Affinibrenneria salicis]|uniref:Mannosyl-3-phosphoglycerate phosphatase-related protein n=1 Tax=Affinibrenneria salicis TaxID=2590031 RepID=A0A5J5G4T5_9GAMM|nr:mannosyl-3-phosphoglycerate phosphatase-related protein [Affinibrenneria salicis]KAA9001874.1 mannosyl-3-phosphoglycerate phosphatase-related protein [Affinibrenneria salicis]